MGDHTRKRGYYSNPNVIKLICDLLGAPMPTIEVVNDYLHEPGPEQVTSPSERGESNSICVKAPTSSLELLVRRLPGFFEIQYQYELQFRKKSLVQSDYLLALSGLCQTLDLEAIAFESKVIQYNTIQYNLII